jgi:hypothetical protein
MYCQHTPAAAAFAQSHVIVAGICSTDGSPIVRCRLLVQNEVVREPRAAAALHCQPKHQGLPRRVRCQLPKPLQWDAKMHSVRKIDGKGCRSFGLCNNGYDRLMLSREYSACHRLLRLDVHIAEEVQQ